MAKPSQTSEFIVELDTDGAGPQFGAFSNVEDAKARAAALAAEEIPARIVRVEHGNPDYGSQHEPQEMTARWLRGREKSA